MRGCRLRGRWWLEATAVYCVPMIDPASLQFLRVDRVTSRRAKFAIRIKQLPAKHDQHPDRNTAAAIPCRAEIPDIAATLPLKNAALPLEQRIDGRSGKIAGSMVGIGGRFNRKWKSIFRIVAATNNNLVRCRCLVARFERIHPAGIFKSLLCGNLRADQPWPDQAKHAQYWGNSPAPHDRLTLRFEISGSLYQKCGSATKRPPHAASLNSAPRLSHSTATRSTAWRSIRLLAISAVTSPCTAL